MEQLMRSMSILLLLKNTSLFSWSCVFTPLNGGLQKWIFSDSVLDGKGCSKKVESEGLHEAHWRETGSRVGGKVKETDVENHFGMDECAWSRWQLEQKSLEIWNSSQRAFLLAGQRKALWLALSFHGGISYRKHLFWSFLCWFFWLSPMNRLMSAVYLHEAVLLDDVLPADCSLLPWKLIFKFLKLAKWSTVTTWVTQCNSCVLNNTQQELCHWVGFAPASKQIHKVSD